MSGYGGKKALAIDLRGTVASSTAMERRTSKFDCLQPIHKPLSWLEALATGIASVKWQAGNIACREGPSNKILIESIFCRRIQSFLQKVRKSCQLQFFDGWVQSFGDDQNLNLDDVSGMSLVQDW